MSARFIWRAWKTRLRDQRFELRAVREAMRSGGAALDIGANKGSYLVWLARWAQGAPVVAFEPQRSLANYLQAQCMQAGLTNAKVENLALSDRAGELTLFVPGDADSPGASLESSVADKTACHTEQVQVTTLDVYAAQHIGQSVKVIKIDVEGHEMAVLRGAQVLIRRDKPLLVIECEGRHLPAGASVAQLVELVQSWGYSASFVWPRKGELPFSAFNAATHQSEVGERFWDSHDYCNNFLFRPV